MTRPRARTGDACCTRRAQVALKFSVSHPVHENMAAARGPRPGAVLLLPLAGALALLLRTAVRR